MWRDHIPGNTFGWVVFAWQFWLCSFGLAVKAQPRAYRYCLLANSIVGIVHSAWVLDIHFPFRREWLRSHTHTAFASQVAAPLVAWVTHPNPCRASPLQFDPQPKGSICLHYARISLDDVDACAFNIDVEETR